MEGLLPSGLPGQWELLGFLVGLGPSVPAQAVAPLASLAQCLGLITP